ncbi:MAG: XRE family transcriptional regulator [Tatlockia sp.]|nr:XRE family transcriptional regulator [Tatlockia sp.]
MNNSDELKITKSYGNVFQDLDIPNAEEHLLKADFAILINRIIKDKKLPQESAAKILGIDQPKVSKLSQGHLAGFSIDRLIRFLILLNQDIEINVRPHSTTINRDNNCKHY